MPVKLSSSLVLALLIGTVLAAPSLGKEEREAIAKFRATAMDVTRGTGSFLDIVVYEWTSDADSAEVAEAFAKGGNEALYDWLDDQKDRAYVRTPNSLRYEMKYAYTFEHEGKQHIVLGTDRPLGFLEVTNSARSLDYNISYVHLVLDPSTETGDGTAAAGAKFEYNEETGQLEIEVPGTHPIQLLNVTKQ